MIAISFLTGELLLAAVWLTVRAAVCIRRRHIDWKREACLLLMYVNLAVLLRFTFYPMERVNGRVEPLWFDPDGVFPLRVNFVPLVHILEYDSLRDTLLNIIGNAAMFIPTGIILPVLYKRLNSFWKVTAAGFGLSLAIELLQLPFSVRATDIDDLLLNTLGCMAGYGVYRFFRRHRASIDNAGKM